MKYIPKLQTAWSPLTLTPEKEQAAQKLIQQRALQGYNTSGVNWLKETPEITSKRKALAAKQQTEYQNKRFANRTNEVPVLGMPAATQIGLKNVSPEFALMTGGVGSGMTGIKGAMGYGAIQGGLWNSAGIAGEQNLEGLAGDVIGGGIAGGVIKGASPYVKKGFDYIRNYVKNPWKLNPWAFKPDPDAYYRMGDGMEFIDDVVRTNKIRAYNKNSYANLRDAGKISGIREDGKIVLKAKTFPEADTYWSKGVPLDGRFSSQKYGDYMIEASNDIPFIQAANQKTKQRGFWDAPDVNYNSTHAKGSYVKPRQSYGYDTEGNIKPSIGTPLEYNPEFIKLYIPHWLKGYKEIKTGAVAKQLHGYSSAGGLSNNRKNK